MSLVERPQLALLPSARVDTPCTSGTGDRRPLANSSGKRVLLRFGRAGHVQAD